MRKEFAVALSGAAAAETALETGSRDNKWHGSTVPTPAEGGWDYKLITRLEN
jgi:hypothetical protein